MSQPEMSEAVCRRIELIARDGLAGANRDERLAQTDEIRRSGPAASTALDERLLGRIADLSKAVRSAGSQLDALRELVDKVTAPPLHPALLVEFVELADGTGAVVACGESRRVVSISPDICALDLPLGCEVLLASERNVILAVPGQRLHSAGETATFERVIGDGRMVLKSRDEELVVDVAAGLRGANLKKGDAVRWSRAAGFVLEQVAHGEGAHVFLEDTPTETFADVAGLDAEIERLTRSIRLRREHGAVAARYGVKPTGSILFAGPPGTGKTLLARALANWLASLSPSKRARFCPVAPGSLSSPWYGVSEANIRSLFAAAREAGERDPDTPVVLWLDEVDGIGARRGSSHTRVDDRVLLALMAELDGFAGRGNLLVVAATNRKSDLDPGLLRPGRLGDVVLEIRRPNRSGALAILERHFGATTPVEAGLDRRAMLDAVAARIYAPNGMGPVAQVLFRDGKKRAVGAPELVNGAILASIVRDAVERAAVREAEGGTAGVRPTDLLEATDDAFQSLVANLSPGNCRGHLDDLPQDVDVVRIESGLRPARRDYRYLRSA